MERGQGGMGVRWHSWPEMDAGTVGPCLGSTELQNWAFISTSKTASTFKTFNVQRSTLTSIPSSRRTLRSPTTFVCILPSRSLHSLKALDLHIIRICTSLRTRSGVCLELLGCPFPSAFFRIETQIQAQSLPVLL